MKDENRMSMPRLFLHLEGLAFLIAALIWFAHIGMDRAVG
jgi:hypothetical protein